MNNFLKAQTRLNIKPRPTLHNNRLGNKFQKNYTKNWRKQKKPKSNCSMAKKIVDEKIVFF